MTDRTSPSPDLVAVLAGLAVTAGLMFLPGLLNDGDTFLHVRVGEQMIANGEIFRTDTFSRSMAGKPWQVHEWLAQMVLGYVHLKTGWSGVMLLTAGCIGGAAGLITGFLARRIEWLYAIVIVAAGLAVASSSFLARPHVLTYPLLALVAVEVMAATEGWRRPRLLILLPAFWIWANFHGSVVIGLGLIGAAGLEAVLSARFDRVDTGLRWALVGLACAVAAILGPNGLETLIFPVLHAGNEGLRFIGEWQPASFVRITPFEVVVGLTFLALSRGVRVPLPRMLLLLALLHMSLQHVRHQQLFGLLAPVLLATPLAALRPSEASRRIPVWGLAALAVLIAAIGGLRLALPHTPQDSASVPVTALRSLPAEVRARPVFNDYAFGAALIYMDIPPEIDSRVELYGATRVADYGRIVADRCRLAKALKDSSAGWTIFQPATPAARMMEAMPGWQRLYVDGFAIVHLRDETAADSLPAGCPAPAS